MGWEHQGINPDLLTAPRGRLRDPLSPSRPHPSWRVSQGQSGWGGEDELVNLGPGQAGPALSFRPDTSTEERMRPSPALTFEGRERERERATKG